VPDADLTAAPRLSLHSRNNRHFCYDRNNRYTGYRKNFRSPSPLPRPPIQADAFREDARLFLQRPTRAMTPPEALAVVLSS
jgi:hypothetical protein